jgi:hypothetical protein
MKAKKFCPDCGRNLYLNQFQNNASRADGKQVYCRDCQNLRNADNALANPEKVAARRVVNAAIKHGDLTRGTHCESCASTNNIDAHHEDYSKPLEVIWLCRSCHQRLHDTYVEASVRAELEAISAQQFAAEIAKVISALGASVDSSFSRRRF